MVIALKIPTNTLIIQPDNTYTVMLFVTFVLIAVSECLITHCNNIAKTIGNLI